MDTTNKYFLPISVIAAGILIAGAVMWNSSGTATTSSSGFGNAESIDKLNATIPGLDAQKIAAEVIENAQAYQALADAEKAEGTKAGVQSTPSSLIGNQLIVGAYPYATFKSALDNPNGIADVNPVTTSDVSIEGKPFIGLADAPVTMIFWSDYQCTFCKSFETGGVPQVTTPAALPQIIAEYVETGKVKIVFMDFAFLGPDSITAALYNQAVWKLYPEQYFEWRTAIYKAQDDENDSSS